MGSVKKRTAGGVASNISKIQLPYIEKRALIPSGEKKRG